LGKNIFFRFRENEKETITDKAGAKKILTFRRVMRVIERTIRKKGQPMLIPEA
jgi:hypothetical protein